MATALSLFPARVQFVDPNTGLLTLPALKALAIVYDRLGGATAPTINELSFSDDEDSGLEEIRAELSKAIEGLQAAPQPEWLQIEHLQTQVEEAHALLAELRKEVEDLKQGQML